MSEAPSAQEVGDAFGAQFTDLPQATALDDAKAAAIGRQSSAFPWLLVGAAGLALLILARD
jgi:hypothetical protein